MKVRFCLAALLALIVASPAAAAKEYQATRFDSKVEVQPGGALQVTETIVFVFSGGTFTQVFRTIPTRYTDGIEFVSASMDGQPMAQGKGPGQVEVRRKEGLRIDWNFAPVSDSTHTFEVTYLARGIVKQAEGSDLLEWRALPREHRYTIANATVEVTGPEPPAAAPRLETRRVDSASDVITQDRVVTARASGIRRNGSLVVSIPFPPGSVLDGPPAWQAKQFARQERLPEWLMAAGVALMVSFVLLFALRQNYDPPPRDAGVRWDSMIPPDPTLPAVAGALAANGQPQLEHAMATLFSLAERGVIAIREDPKGRFGQRDFSITFQRLASQLAPHEEVALDIVFQGTPSTNASVSLAKARTYLTRRFSRFKAAVRHELAEAHLIDGGRQANRRRYLKLGAALLVLAGIGVIPCAILADREGGGPFFIPLALAIAGVTSLIIAASRTPLSNDGVRRAEQWRAFKRHLSDPQAIEPRWGASGTGEARILPLAVALGLAAAWSKFMKKRNVQTPGWFHAISNVDGGHAFATLVATGGAGAHSGGGHSAGGGVAGGGSSGAH